MFERKLRDIIHSTLNDESLKEEEISCDLSISLEEDFEEELETLEKMFN
jgi:hypothetical protein